VTRRNCHNSPAAKAGSFCLPLSARLKPCPNTRLSRRNPEKSL
jgi:hypothetical protein